MAKKNLEQAPALPIITIDHVRSMREQGQLARVEVYPIPEAQSPDSPSAIVRTLPPGLEESFPVSTILAGRGERRFVIDGGVEHPIHGRGIIGRAPDPVEGGQTIVISDPRRSLSRSHLAFETDARGRVFIADLDSANGTEIVSATGERIECVPGRRYPVAVGDTVLIGDFTVTLRTD